jgi:acetylornithine deacetylase/succinyl-diaminopimelate desuccinylase-like protein
MIKQILTKLISFKTIPNSFAENKKAIFWIGNFLKKFPLHLEYFQFSKHFSLIALTQKTKNPILWLAAHQDVVPGSSELFKARIKQKKLFGRGAFDMKFAIACYLRLVQELKGELQKYNFGIMITSDEEIGGFFGTKRLIEKGYKGKVVFLPDGGKDWKFEVEAKGVFHLKIKAYGKSAHGSKPWEGDGANERLVDFLTELRKFFPKEPCNLKNHWHPTLNIGKIEGGTATNQVSDFAQAFLDVRFPKKIGKRKILEGLRKCLKKFRKIKMEEIVFANPYSTDPKNKFLKIFSQIAYSKFKIKTSFDFSHGSSDGRFFAEKNIPVILIRPRGGGQHSENEHIDLGDLEKYYLVLKEFVKRVALM